MRTEGRRVRPYYFAVSDPNLVGCTVVVIGGMAITDGPLLQKAGKSLVPVSSELECFARDLKNLLLTPSKILIQISIKAISYPPH